jgi:hypothetical protein
MKILKFVTKLQEWNLDFIALVAAVDKSLWALSELK